MHGESVLTHSKPCTQLWLTGGWPLGWWLVAFCSLLPRLQACCSPVPLLFSKISLLFAKLLLPLFLPQASLSLFPGSSQVWLNLGVFFDSKNTCDPAFNTPQDKYISRALVSWGGPIVFQSIPAPGTFLPHPRGSETVLLPQLCSPAPTPA